MPRLDDPLEQYHEVLRDHEQLVAPRLEQLRREVDEAIDELHRLERRHLSRQRRALTSLRTQLQQDARFVLRSTKFAAFVEALIQSAMATLPGELGEPLSGDPAGWVLGSTSWPVAIEVCESIQEEGYEGEHDCLRDVLGLGLRLGATSVRVEVERGLRLLTGGQQPVPLVYQHHELGYVLSEHLASLGLDDETTRRLGREVAAVVLYAAPILLQEPTGTSFSDP